MLYDMSGHLFGQHLRHIGPCTTHLAPIRDKSIARDAGGLSPSTLGGFRI